MHVRVSAIGYSQSIHILHEYIANTIKLETLASLYSACMQGISGFMVYS